MTEPNEPQANPDPVTLTVCTTCRMADSDPEAPRPGRVLAQSLAGDRLPQGVTFRAVECLSACSRGCSILIEGGDARWSYLYGDLDPETHVEDILAGLTAYTKTSDGLVPWRERPVIFRKQSIARIPPRSMAGVALTEEEPQ